MVVQGKRARGRQKQRWMDNIGEDMTDKHLLDQMICMAQMVGEVFSETSTPYRSGIKIQGKIIIITFKNLIPHAYRLRHIGPGSLRLGIESKDDLQSIFCII